MTVGSPPAAPSGLQTTPAVALLTKVTRTATAPASFPIAAVVLTVHRPCIAPSAVLGAAHPPKELMPPCATVEAVF